MWVLRIRFNVIHIPSIVLRQGEDKESFLTQKFKKLGMCW